MPLEITNLGIVGVALFVLFSMISVLLVYARIQDNAIKGFTRATERFTSVTEKWLARLDDIQEDGRARDIYLHNMNDKIDRILTQITSRKHDSHEVPKVTPSVSQDQMDSSEHKQVD